MLFWVIRYDEDYLTLWATLWVTWNKTSRNSYSYDFVHYSSREKAHVVLEPERDSIVGYGRYDEDLAMLRTDVRIMRRLSYFKGENLSNAYSKRYTMWRNSFPFVFVLIHVALPAWSANSGTAIVVTPHYCFYCCFKLYKSYSRDQLLSCVSRE